VRSPNLTPPECHELEDVNFIIEKRKRFSALQRVEVFSIGWILSEILTSLEVF
jgi:hypothetical protein